MFQFQHSNLQNFFRPLSLAFSTNKLECLHLASHFCPFLYVWQRPTCPSTGLVRIGHLGSNALAYLPEVSVMKKKVFKTLWLTHFLIQPKLFSVSASIGTRDSGVKFKFCSNLLLQIFILTNFVLTIISWNKNLFYPKCVLTNIGIKKFVVTKIWCNKNLL